MLTGDTGMVLNIAMLHVGRVLQEPAFTKFPLKQLAYNFDNYPFFEKKYKGEGKWNYPFGQHFIMEELDDCGAMGASVIEVFQLDPQDKYRAYIDQAMKHISIRQSRMKDGPFIRSFPRKWTIWADDLHECFISCPAWENSQKTIRNSMMQRSK